VSGPAFHVLNIDNHGGSVAMVRHLLQAGHRSVALIAGPSGNFDASERERGYREAMARHAPRAALTVVPGDFTEESGYRAGHELLARAKRPRAVFAANDMMAVGCLAAFKDAGVRVPEDIALAGFDDIPIARYVTPALSTVRVRIADFGRLALERLVQVVEHPGQESPSADTLGFEIVVRDTCGGTKPEQNS
jgi:LacI family transcriptional regulator